MIIKQFYMFTQHQQINNRSSARTILATPEDYYDWKRATEILLQEKDLWKYIDGSERKLKIQDRLEANKKRRSDFIIKHGMDALTPEVLTALDLNDEEKLTSREKIAFDIGDKSTRAVIRSTLGGIYLDMASDMAKYETSEDLWNGINNTVDSKSDFNSTYLISQILTETVGGIGTDSDGKELQEYLQRKQEHYRRLKDMGFEVTLESLYGLGLVLGLQGGYENFRRILISKALKHGQVEDELRKEVQYLNYRGRMTSHKRPNALVADGVDDEGEADTPVHRRKRSKGAKMTICKVCYNPVTLQTPAF